MVKALLWIKSDYSHFKVGKWQCMDCAIDQPIYISKPIYLFGKENVK